jgi:RNA polymerase sigma factor (sigma-70 family)
MNIETNDARLWEDFRKGDKKALSHIYHFYVQKLYRYGKKFSSDDALIKDTIQDLFFDLIRIRSRLGSTDNIYFYLIKSFRRRLLKNLNRRKITERSSEHSGDIELNIVYSIEDELIQKEDLSKNEEMIQKGLAELSPKQREILYYRYTCDFEYEQICELMSMKYDSARKMVFRALKTLREHLTETNFLFLVIHCKLFRKI